MLPAIPAIPRALREPSSALGTDWVAVSMACDRLEVHLSATWQQYQRLQDSLSHLVVGQTPLIHDQEAVARYMRDALERCVPALGELHLYAVSLGQAARMLSVITRPAALKPARDILDSFWSRIEFFMQIRHCFEHFHDRVPGGKDERRVAPARGRGFDPSARVYWGFQGGKFIHSNESYSMDSSSLELIAEASEKVMACSAAVITAKEGQCFGGTI